MSVAQDFSQASLIIAQTYVEVRASVPVSAQTAIDAIVGTVVMPERVSEFFEFGYAHRDDLSAELRERVADVGHFAWVNGFWGLGIDGRGSKMETVLRGKDLPKGVDAPAPSGKYGANDAEMPGAAG